MSTPTSHPWISQSCFSGTIVDLVALDPSQHRDQLIVAGSDPSIWSNLRFLPGDTPAGMDAYVAELIHRRDTHQEVPLCIVHRAHQAVIGVTRFIDIRQAHRSVEFGTWITPHHHGDGSNADCKFLMLQYAFETLGCIRVQIKTDANNMQSQRSLVALGATFEAHLRNHLMTPSGRIRDSLIYSIIDSEWPTVKANLTQRIAKHQTKHRPTT
jgi:RimJ/RimL family protein N-acetyltransferase